MTYGGEALGRHEGKAIFVTGGLPGEVVRIAIEDNRARFVREQVSRPVPTDLSHRNRGIVPLGQSGYTVSGDWACPNRMPCAMA
jgi:hypothetical protein